MFSGYGSDFGVSTTLPANMLDNNPSTYWSNRYSKVATQTLNAVTNARPSDWVSVTWAPAKQVDQLQASFITDANDELPASVTVYYRSGQDWIPVTNQHVTLRHRLEPAVDDHVRPGQHHRAQARHDERRTLRPQHRQPGHLGAAHPGRQLTQRPDRAPRPPRAPRPSATIDSTAASSGDRKRSGPGPGTAERSAVNAAPVPGAG